MSHSVYVLYFHYHLLVEGQLGCFDFLAIESRESAKKLAETSICAV